jgi:hypothetical protein
MYQKITQFQIWGTLPQQGSYRLEGNDMTAAKIRTVHPLTRCGSKWNLRQKNLLYKMKPFGAKVRVSKRKETNENIQR